MSRKPFVQFNISNDVVITNFDVICRRDMHGCFFDLKFRTVRQARGRLAKNRAVPLGFARGKKRKTPALPTGRQAFADVHPIWLRGQDSENYGLVIYQGPGALIPHQRFAPRPGFEPGTLSLTGIRSTVELPGSESLVRSR